MTVGELKKLLEKARDIDIVRIEQEEGSRGLGGTVYYNHFYEVINVISDRDTGDRPQFFSIVASRKY